MTSSSPHVRARSKRGCANWVVMENVEENVEVVWLRSTLCMSCCGLDLLGTLRPRTQTAGRYQLEVRSRSNPKIACMAASPVVIGKRVLLCLSASRRLFACCFSPPTKPADTLFAPGGGSLGDRCRQEEAQCAPSALCRLRAAPELLMYTAKEPIHMELSPCSSSSCLRPSDTPLPAASNSR